MFQKAHETLPRRVNKSELTHVKQSRPQLIKSICEPPSIWSLQCLDASTANVCTASGRTPNPNPLPVARESASDLEISLSNATRYALQHWKRSCAMSCKWSAMLPLVNYRRCVSATLANTFTRRATAKRFRIARHANSVNRRERRGSATVSERLPFPHGEDFLEGIVSEDEKRAFMPKIFDIAFAMNHFYRSPEVADVRRRFYSDFKGFQAKALFYVYLCWDQECTFNCQRFNNFNELTAFPVKIYHTELTEFFRFSNECCWNLHRIRSIYKFAVLNLAISSVKITISLRMPKKRIDNSMK